MNKLLLAVLFISSLGFSQVAQPSHGGTGLNTTGNHKILVGTGPSTYSLVTVPDCQDTAGNHLNFTQSSNSVTCGSSSGLPVDFTCNLEFGQNNGPILADADISPQVPNRCYIPQGATVIEIMVTADAGTPSVLIAKNHLGTDTNLTLSALATASSGGRACSSAAGGTSVIDGSTVCSATLTTTSSAAGDYFEPNGGTAGGTAKAFSAAITYTTP